MRILESELLAVAMSATPGSSELLQSITSDERRTVAARLKEVFTTLEALDGVSIEEIAIEGRTQLDSVLFGKKSGGMVLAYSFSGLASDLVVPLFTAAVAFFTDTLGPGLASAVGNASVGLYRNLSVLKIPEDADAIDVLRTVIDVRASLGNYSTSHFPSTAEIIEASTLGRERVVIALRALAGRKILAVSNWENQRDDESALGNRWTFVV